MSERGGGKAERSPLRDIDTAPRNLAQRYHECIGELGAEWFPGRFWTWDAMPPKEREFSVAVMKRFLEENKTYFGGLE